MDQIVHRQRTIPRPLDQRTLSKPPDRMSWSSKDARATHASRGHHRLRWPHLVRQLEWSTSLGLGVRRRHSSASRASLSLARLGSVVVTWSWSSAVVGHPPQGGNAAGLRHHHRRWHARRNPPLKPNRAPLVIKSQDSKYKNYIYIPATCYIIHLSYAFCQSKRTKNCFQNQNYFCP
jgi:hypothetical protein